MFAEETHWDLVAYLLGKLDFEIKMAVFPHHEADCQDPLITANACFNHYFFLATYA